MIDMIKLSRITIVTLVIFLTIVNCTSILFNVLSVLKNKATLFEEAYCPFEFTHEKIQEVNSVS